MDSSSPDQPIESDIIHQPATSIILDLYLDTEYNVSSVSPCASRHLTEHKYDLHKHDLHKHDLHKHDLFSIATLITHHDHGRRYPIMSSQWFLHHPGLNPDTLSSFWRQCIVSFTGFSEYPATLSECPPNARIFARNYDVGEEDDKNDKKDHHDKNDKISLYDILTTPVWCHTREDIDIELSNMLESLVAHYKKQNIETKFMIQGFGVINDLHLLKEWLPLSYRCLSFHLMHNIHRSGDVITPSDTCDIACLKNFLLNNVHQFPVHEVRRCYPTHDSLEDVKTAYRYTAQVSDIINKSIECYIERYGNIPQHDFRNQHGLDTCPNYSALKQNRLPNRGKFTFRTLPKSESKMDVNAPAYHPSL